MTFNHRVIRDKDGYLAIHEVYYNGDGSLAARTESAVWVGGEDLAEVREQLELMLRCLDAPVIDDFDWPGFDFSKDEE